KINYFNSQAIRHRPAAIGADYAIRHPDRPVFVVAFLPGATRILARYSPSRPSTHNILKKRLVSSGKGSYTSSSFQTCRHTPCNHGASFMRFDRLFTTAGKSPYAAIEFRTATSEIRNPDGSVVFRLDNVEVPKAWSRVAIDILAQKYFRKAGVPMKLKPVEENTVPSWLWRSEADVEALESLPEQKRYGSETSAKQVFDRLAGTWTYWGWKGKYFDSEED